MKYARDYIERLLHETEPLEALARLGTIWSTREGVSEDKPHFGFSEPEFHVHMYLLYQGEVGNGGHAQFFMNPSGRHAIAVKSALQALGFDWALTILQRACSEFPQGEVPQDHQKREDTIATLPEQTFVRWAELDKEFYKIDSAYWGALMAYLRKNDDQVLQPERK